MDFFLGQDLWAGIMTAKTKWHEDNNISLWPWESKFKLRLIAILTYKANRTIWRKQNIKKVIFLCFSFFLIENFCSDIWFCISCIWEKETFWRRYGMKWKSIDSRGGMGNNKLFCKKFLHLSFNCNWNLQGWEQIAGKPFTEKFEIILNVFLYIKTLWS